MSDEAPEVQVAAEETPAPAPAPAVPEKMDAMTAVQQVLKSAVHVDGLARGLHEVCKSLEQDPVQLCVLANDCEEANITKLIEALCAEKSISLLKLDSRKKLGEWAGLCKLDKDGNARKVVACSVVAVKAYGPRNQAHDVLEQHLKSQ